MPTDAASLALGKDLIGIETLSPAQLRFILDTAEPFKEVSERAIKKVPALRGKTIVNLFFEASTRTRISFEFAEKRLSADTVNVATQGSSVSKGETLVDTARNLEAMRIDMVVIRHGSSGAAKFLGDRIASNVINAGDGKHEHPTQALLDLLTLRDKFGRIEGLKVAICGDILHSRVARSNIWGLTKLGAEVGVCGPPSLLPRDIEELDRRPNRAGGTGRAGGRPRLGTRRPRRGGARPCRLTPPRSLSARTWSGSRRSARPSSGSSSTPPSRSRR